MKAKAWIGTGEVFSPVQVQEGAPHDVCGGRKQRQQ
jgi:hypothetical protein